MKFAALDDGEDGEYNGVDCVEISKIFECRRHFPLEQGYLTQLSSPSTVLRHHALTPEDISHI